MHTIQTLSVAAATLAVGCSQLDPATAGSSSPMSPNTTHHVAALSPTQLENDQACKSMYGLPCNELTHLVGPLTAELRKETRACVKQAVSTYVNDRWVSTNKLCIALSM